MQLAACLVVILQVGLVVACCALLSNVTLLEFDLEALARSHSCQGWFVSSPRRSVYLLEVYTCMPLEHICYRAQLPAHCVQHTLVARHRSIDGYGVCCCLSGALMGHACLRACL